MLSFYRIFENNISKYNAEMQLCSQDLEKFLNNVSPNNIYYSPKIDGVRCWAIVNKRTIPDKQGFRKIGFVKYLSRNNKEFQNFSKFDKNLIEIAHVINNTYRIKYPIIFDTEVTSKDKTLSSTMTQLRRIRNMNPDIFVMNLFDLAIPNIEFLKRYKILNDSYKTINDKSIKIIPYKSLKDPNFQNIHKLKDEMIKIGYEGVVLADSSSKYQFNKRTISFVKVKEKNTMDLEIVDIKLGDPGTRWEGLVAAIICDLDGKRVQVSGRIDAQTRREWAKNPPIGTIAEIEYKEITPKGNLREPIFIRLREDK